MRLYRLEYSCYARKAQMVLDLLGLDYECIDVVFGDRSELAKLTGGYIQVPVLVDDGGRVIVDSRAICADLVSREPGTRLVPSPWEGPIWAYADWCDGPLEDVMFRIATPLARRNVFTDPWERALYVFVKERKFGRGCVEEWERTHGDLIARARELLEPSRRTLARQPFLFGAEPTLADAALYGQTVMLELVDAELPARLGPEIPPWMRRVEAASRSARA
jgi:glutathione S-transferase